MAAVPLETIKKQLMANPEFRREYDALEDEFSLAATLGERSRPFFGRSTEAAKDNPDFCL